MQKRAANFMTASSLFSSILHTPFILSSHLTGILYIKEIPLFTPSGSQIPSLAAFLTPFDMV
jgi:hypothetical protein